MIDLLLRAANILSPVENAVNYTHAQDILIEGNRISAVLPTGQADPAQARQVIDAGGMIALPGLINTHCHTAMVLFRGLADDVSVDRWFNEFIWPFESNLTPEDVYWGTLLGLAEMIEAGVTTVADHYFYMDEVARAIDQAGTRGLLAWAVFSAGVPEPEKKLNETLEWIERWQGSADGRITTWLGPHAPYTCSEEFLNTVSATARRAKVGIHIHVSETQAQVEMSLKQHGRTPIALLRDAGVFESPTLLAHAAHPTPDDIQIMVKAEAGVAHCPKTYLKLASGVMNVVEVRNAGVNIGIGTDGAASNSSYDILEQTRLAALMQKHQHVNAQALPINDALHMMMTGGAKALRMPDLGAIAAGKLADVILLRTDSARMQPLINPAANVLYSAQAGDVDTVICNGKVLLQERQLLTLDKQAIVREVQSRLHRLSQRIPGQRIQTYPT
ncbi:MAG: amidohydrolase [Anaerolineae bacterium]|nr:amidohydrolase [Anaerolineae bacterium]